MLYSKLKAQKRLSILWFVSSAILIMLFIAFTFLGRFDSKNEEAWAWLSQNIIPTLTLMVGTFYINVNQSTDDKKIDIFYYRLCYAMSVFYMAVLFATILFSPIVFEVKHISIIELFQESKIFLIIIQGIMTYTLGLFFVKENKN
jgi:hypothetical protein